MECVGWCVQGWRRVSCRRQGVAGEFESPAGAVFMRASRAIKIALSETIYRGFLLLVRPEREEPKQKNEDSC